MPSTMRVLRSALLLALASAAISAQAVTLFDNLEERTDGIMPLWTDLWTGQSFKVGATAMTLTNVTIEAAGPQGLTLSLYRDADSGSIIHPGSRLGNLEPGVDFGDGLLSFGGNDLFLNPTPFTGSSPTAPSDSRRRVGLSRGPKTAPELVSAFRSATARQATGIGRP